VKVWEGKGGASSITKERVGARRNKKREKGWSVGEKKGEDFEAARGKGRFVGGWKEKGEGGSTSCSQGRETPHGNKGGGRKSPSWGKRALTRRREETGDRRKREGVFSWKGIDNKQRRGGKRTSKRKKGKKKESSTSI